MTDDRWGSDEGDPFDDLDDEFGAVRFADDARPGADSTGPDGTTAATSGLSFGAHDTGDLPHWTEPPSRENPRTPSVRGDDLWGSLGDDEDDPFLGEEFPSDRQPRDRSAGNRDNTGETSGMRTPPRRGIGGGLGGRGTAPRGQRPGNRPIRTPRGPSGGRQRGQGEDPLNAPADRDMPTAVGVGLGLAALFVLLNVLGRSWMVLILVCAIIFILNAIARQGIQFRWTDLRTIKIKPPMDKHCCRTPRHFFPLFFEKFKAVGRLEALGKSDDNGARLEIVCHFG